LEIKIKALRTFYLENKEGRRKKQEEKTPKRSGPSTTK
jgi:hypothetical protein